MSGMSNRDPSTVDRFHIATARTLVGFTPEFEKEWQDDWCFAVLADTQFGMYE